MNKKKLVSLCLVLALLLTAAVGGTMAYFTDTDGATNVMTTGNVKIVQNEQERGENELVDFEDNHKLAPYTGSVNDNGVANAWGTAAEINDTTYNMFDQSKNAIDKIVTVTNEGTEEAYIRTLFAFEIPEGKDDTFLNDQSTICLVGNLGLDNRAFRDTGATFTYGDAEYAVFEYYYANDSKLAAGETSHPSLRQVYLNAKVGNEWYDAVGEKYNILVLSQATQTQGFDGAVTALETAFGKVAGADSATLQEWFADCVEINFGF